MKKLLPSAIALIVIAALAIGFSIQQTHRSAFDLSTFGKLPALHGEEVTSLDTIARKTLYAIRGSDKVTTPDNIRINSIEWMAEVLFDSNAAKQSKIFVISNDQIFPELSQHSVENETSLWERIQRRFFASSYSRVFSYEELDPHIESIMAQARVAVRTPSKDRTQEQNGIINLSNDLQVFLHLTQTLRYKDKGSVVEDIKKLVEFVPDGMNAFELNRSGKAFDQTAFNLMSQVGIAYQNFEHGSHFFPIPYPAPDNTQWRSMGYLLRDIINKGAPSPIVLSYAELADAYSNNDPATFNQSIIALKNQLKEQVPNEYKKSVVSQTLNKLLPLKTSLIAYCAAFILSLVSWKYERLKSTAITVAIAALTFHSISLLAQKQSTIGYANEHLYLTIIFTGWIAVTLTLVLSAKYRTITGVFAASLIGLLSLAAAADLATQDYFQYSENTLTEFINHWQVIDKCAHHFSYAASLVAGTLATIVALMKLFSVKLNQGPYIRLTVMAFTSLCLATASGLIGITTTCLISDAFTGLYWNWSPTDNGKLVLFTYNLAVLLAYLDRHIAARGFIISAIFGTIIAAWSIVGVSVIETQEITRSFWYFVVFAATQILSIVLATLPRKYWSNRITL